MNCDYSSSFYLWSHWIVPCFPLQSNAAEILNIKEAKKRLKSPRQRAEASAMPRHCAEGWLWGAFKACLNANGHLSHMKKESVAVKYIFISALWACGLLGIRRGSTEVRNDPLVFGDLLFFCLCEAISASWIVLSFSSTVPVCHHPSLFCVWRGLETV